MLYFSFYMFKRIHCLKGRGEVIISVCFLKKMRRFYVKLSYKSKVSMLQERMMTIVSNVSPDSLNLHQLFLEFRHLSLSVHDASRGFEDLGIFIITGLYIYIFLRTSKGNDFKALWYIRVSIWNVEKCYIDKQIFKIFKDFFQPFFLIFREPDFFSWEVLQKRPSRLCPSTLQ